MRVASSSDKCASVIRFLFTARQPPVGLASSLSVFIDLTYLDTPYTLRRTPLDEGSARRTDLYLTTRNTHNRPTAMPTTGFEPAVPRNDRPQAHSFDRMATGTGFVMWYKTKRGNPLTISDRVPDQLPVVQSIPCGQPDVARFL